MIKYKFNEQGQYEILYFDKNGRKIHEGDIIEYPDGTKKQVYLTDDGELGTDATNPKWIKSGRAVPCEYGIYPLTDNDLENVTCHRAHTCCICGKQYDELGHNADPVKRGFCCDACNATVVIPARVDYFKSHSKYRQF